MKVALITGIAGQDGCYLSQLLLQKGYRVVGTAHDNSPANLWRLSEEGHLSDVEVRGLDLRDSESFQRLVMEVQPNEIYNLAAQSLVGKSIEQPIYTSQVNSMAVLSMLEFLVRKLPDTRYYQASSSEIFGNTTVNPQTEKTCFQPRNPYGVSKQFAHWMTKTYRENFHLHASCGILYNHESPYRGENFITGKITRGLARVKLGLQSHIEVGNIEARRDWGFSGDYVRAMYLMLQQDQADDYIIATGTSHSVKDLIDQAALILELPLDWDGDGVETVGRHSKTGQILVSINEKFYRKNENSHLVGDPSKAVENLGWKPNVSFAQLIEKMIARDLKFAELESL